MRIAKGRAVVRLRLPPSAVARVRRTGRRGLAVVIRAQALSGARKPLAGLTKRTRLRR